MISTRVELTNEFKKDYVKRLLLLVRYMLESLNIWPENRTKIKNFFALINCGSSFLIILGQVYAVATPKRLDNVFVSTLTITVAFIEIQILAKMLPLIYGGERLKLVWETIGLQFWSLDVVDRKTNEHIKKRIFFVRILMVTYFVVGVIAGMEFFTFAFLQSTPTLPMYAEYPFNWSESPVFQMLVVWQWMSTFTGYFAYAAFDIFFVASLECCNTQFLIINFVLKNAFKKSKLFKKHKFLNESFSTEELLNKCIKQHNLLIWTCKELEKVFTPALFIKFLTDVVTICMMNFVMAYNPQYIVQVIFVLVTVTFSLFLFSLYGDEIATNSLSLADVAFHSQWYKLANAKLQKTLIMMMQRSQRTVTVTGTPFLNINLETFAKILKMSFSLFTLLRNVVNK